MRTFARTLAAAAALSALLLGFAVSTLFSGAGVIAYVAMHLLVPTDDDAPAGAHAATA